MYAVMGSASIQPGREDEGTEHLKSQIIPMVKQAPGVIAGYWLAPKDGRGWGIVLFQTEEAPGPGRRWPTRTSRTSSPWTGLRSKR